MLKILTFLAVVSTGLFDAPSGAPGTFSNLHLRHTPSGVILTGTVLLPRGVTPPVAAHIDVVGADGSIVASPPLPAAHPRTSRYRHRRFAVELPADFVPVRLALHLGAHS